MERKRENRKKLMSNCPTVCLIRKLKGKFDINKGLSCHRHDLVKFCLLSFIFLFKKKNLCQFFNLSKLEIWNWNVFSCFSFLVNDYFPAIFRNQTSRQQEKTTLRTENERNPRSKTSAGVEYQLESAEGNGAVEDWDRLGAAVSGGKSLNEGDDRF